MWLLSTIIKIAALLSYAFLVLLVFRSSAPINVRRYFFVYIFGMIYWQFASLMVNFSSTQANALFWYNMFIPGTGLYSVLFFPFTRAFLRIKGQKKLTVLAFLTCLALVGVGSSRITFDAVRMGNAGIYVPDLTIVVYFIGPAGYFFWCLGVFNLVREWVRTSSSYQRNRIMYLLLGAAFVIVGTISNFTPLQDYPIDITLNLFNAALIGYAVIRYRLLDIRVFLIRSLFYSLLTGLLIGIYIGCIILIESVLKRSLGYTSPISGIIAFLILAVLFLPIRNRLQIILDKLFFREKQNYQKILESFSRAVTSIRHSDELIELLVKTVDETIKPARTILLLKNNDTGTLGTARSVDHSSEDLLDLNLPKDDRLVNMLVREGAPVIRDELQANARFEYLLDGHRDIFSLAEVSVLVPVLLKERLIGIICLGRRRSGAMYVEDDLGFLTTLANQTATALDNALIYMEIQRRLSEQTLLFILSETFRRSIDINDVIQSVVRILNNFLKIDNSGIVYFELRDQARQYSFDPLTAKALDIAIECSVELLVYYQENDDDDVVPPPVLVERIAEDSNLAQNEREVLSSLVYLPLKQRGDVLGLLVIPNRRGGESVHQKELELLRTIRSIVSQGIMLQRTINDLISVENYNESILNSMDDMGDTLVIFDLNRRISAVNRALCELTGYGQNELVGSDITVIAPGVDEMVGKQVSQAIFESGSIMNYELVYRSKSGTEVPMLFSGSLMKDKKGRAEAVIGIARDITEHKRAEEYKKNLLLIEEIHHRVKNNLQVISSLLYLQSDYVSDNRTKAMFIESRNRVHSMALIP